MTACDGDAGLVRYLSELGRSLVQPRRPALSVGVERTLTVALSSRIRQDVKGGVVLACNTVPIANYRLVGQPSWSDSPAVPSMSKSEVVGVGCRFMLT
jgi:hypothetical protein